MSAQSPSYPSQPPKSASINAIRNPITRIPSENAVADTPGPPGPENPPGNSFFEYRKPPPSGESPSGIPQPQARGIHGTDPKDYRPVGGEGSGKGGHLLRQNEDVDSEQMAPESEGKVAQAVRRQSSAAEGKGPQWHGRGRGEVTLDGDEADLERKKAQQSWAREEVKEARREGKDVDGGLRASGRQPQPEV
ncbi:hypothetical protein QBC34DRAFT_165490 [Podospora aff. communis PSN243]|uniref:Uncharacterized protein n=1 Tax=Podospora aff. communis PSN243 TaxID=3040156 RepID=A0AAV9GAY3_9PEZI|nr:hypothetical protein QBC34DRAFT_165490 [Podospora aff. communis PSN243]